MPVRQYQLPRGPMDQPATRRVSGIDTFRATKVPWPVGSLGYGSRTADENCPNRTGSRVVLGDNPELRMVETLNSPFEAVPAYA